MVREIILGRYFELIKEFQSVFIQKSFKEWHPLTHNIPNH